MRHLVRKELERSATVIAGIDEGQILAVVETIVDTYKGGGKVVLFGNGGSAADAQHIAAELTGRYSMEREPLQALALGNLSALTAIGNDYRFEDVFARQVRGLVQDGDTVVAISTSGRSENVLRAVTDAKKKGARTVAFTGARGELKDRVDLALTIPSDRTSRIQEGYMAAAHIVCGLVERRLFAQGAVFVDRDDTLVKDVPYCGRPEDLVLFPGIGKAISRLNQAGLLVIVITNQSGVARGLFTEEMLLSIHERLRHEVAMAGGRIDAIYYCPHHPDEGCSCRKPRTGLIERALEDFNIDLTRSYLIGDSEHDARLAQDLDLPFYRVGPQQGFVHAVDNLLGLRKAQ